MSEKVLQIFILVLSSKLEMVSTANLPDEVIAVDAGNHPLAYLAFLPTLLIIYR